ncbi:MAG: addiction module toxin RelE [Candidatus Nealsonbacteria bacterium CG18_big_fil_WC_8_21_14_2_50_37_10]|uniref:Addiction module toxin RelE n=1 Tax=Candidatus Nealsonbacteria bacterium CG18_big_fil_WC_8_21_14_2_50_37_10 TaxID=1974717 RepID=A0A2H0FJM7_9BACT|nr:MAG: addiction module toxin RelE [Candidatus Nealsonbacteria bacterium CG18_big_fil_WC_8_21_14_2_50_37_10]
MNRQDEYKVYYYQNSHTKRIPVWEYIQKIAVKDRGKIAAYISFLRDCSGQLNEPYGRYIRSGIRELRVEFAQNRHRIFYITVEGRKIILLHAFLKKTPKTPEQEIVRALNNFEDYKINKNFIEYEKET